MNPIPEERRFERLSGILLVFVFLCITSLFRNLMNGNEVSKFTDAMFHIDPEWIPDLFPGNSDFGRRQWLFQLLITPLLRHGTFLQTAVVGRLVCFALLAVGLDDVRRGLRLHPALLLAALWAYLFNQSLVASEWIIGGVEPKVFSYAFTLIALGRLLQHRRLTPSIGLLLGAATSFHVLVGGYATLSILGVLVLSRKTLQLAIRDGVVPGAYWLAGSLFAWRPVIGHVLGRNHLTAGSSDIPASAIYVFHRVPHHTDPSSWPEHWPMTTLVYAAVCAGAFMALRMCFNNKAASGAQEPATLLARFTAVAMIPFVLGLLIAPFDSTGRFLQFYLFRFGDTMLPLSTCLMMTLLAQRVGARLPSRLWQAGCAALLVGALLLPLPRMRRDITALRQAPAASRGVTEEQVAMCAWIREHTPRDALFVTSPWGQMQNFCWLARRGSYGNFKQVNISGGLAEWRERMFRLSNQSADWTLTGDPLFRMLEKGYASLDTTAAQQLMQDSGATYLLTLRGHQLDLPVTHTNDVYILYRSEDAP